MAHSVYAAFQQTVQQWPDNDFLLVLPETAEIFDIEAGPISYQQAFDQVEALAAAYQQAGYGHGHRVGILLENRPAFLLHWLALNKLGVSIVPINPDLRIVELEYLIGHSEMRSEERRVGEECGGGGGGVPRRRGGVREGEGRVGGG